MERFHPVVQIAIISLLFAVPGVVIDTWMARQGLVRGDRITVVIGVVLLVAMKSLFFPGGSWWAWGVAIVVGMILAAHRADLWASMRRGRWWWLRDDR